MYFKHSITVFMQKDSSSNLLIQQKRGFSFCRTLYTGWGTCVVIHLGLSINYMRVASQCVLQRGQMGSLPSRPALHASPSLFDLFHAQSDQRQVILVTSFCRGATFPWDQRVTTFRSFIVYTTILRGSKGSKASFYGIRSMQSDL